MATLLSLFRTLASGAIFVYTWIGSTRLLAIFSASISVAGALYFLDEPLIHENTVFFKVKIGSLLTALWLSTYNYMLAVTESYKIKIDDTEGILPLHLDTLFLIFNFFCFVFAIKYVTEPIQLLSWIMAIYICFSINNYLVVLCYFRKVSPENRANEFNIRIKELKESLSQENGPTAVGYTVLSFGLYLVFRESLGGEVNKEILENIKAFSAGAAGFHLVLSTFKYLTEMEGRGISARILSAANWNENMKNHLALMQREHYWAVCLMVTSLLFFLLNFILLS